MVGFPLTRTFQLGVKSLGLHKLRSGLTVLGIVFGVCSVIAMLAIGEGSKREALEQIRELGANNIIIRSVKPGGGGIFVDITLREAYAALARSRDDLMAILDQLRRGLLPLPTDGRPTDTADLFPTPPEQPSQVWSGRRVAVVATGGSGALASVVGVVRALEEDGVRPAGFGLCSGSTMFGLPLAVLAAIYTSEFLDKKVRSQVKPVIEILREYSRYYIGERYTDGFAQGLLALERNWQGPLLCNAGVMTTVKQFQTMEAAALAELNKKDG